MKRRKPLMSNSNDRKRGDTANDDVFDHGNGGLNIRSNKYRATQLLKKLYNDAFGTAQKAIENDRKGQIQKAKYFYLEAIEYFMQICRLEENEKKGRLFEVKIKEFLTRAEEINSQTKDKEERRSKNGQGPTGEKDNRDNSWITLKQSGEFSLEQAVVADEHEDPKKAFPLYMEAAELYMKAITNLPQNDKHVHMPGLEKILSEILSRAETIKTSTVGISSKNTTSTNTVMHVSSTSTLGTFTTPAVSASTNLSEEELSVLRRSSRINGHLYLPWMDFDLKERFHYRTAWNDPGGDLKVSQKQASRMRGWRRPSEFTTRKPVMISFVSAMSIEQDAVGDCSFVSSLCISAAYERRWRKRLITSIIYPQNRHGQPVYNPSGKYMIKLHYNGIDRKVIVDDRLPLGRNGKLLCACTSNRNELWVSIIEKAYMKLNGGYNFPGSTAAIDMHCLTGWIPESMHMDSKGFDRKRTWERLVSGNKFGDCLICISTPSLSEHEERVLGLVSSHAYAVLDVRNVLGKQLLKVKNPWSHRRWKGAYSPTDDRNWTPELRKALNYDRATASMIDNGCFWIDYNSMLANFRSLYMNWNPDLFAHRKVIHGSWMAHAPGPKNDAYNRGYNPQFVFEVNAESCKGTSAIWLLLTRHVTFKVPLAKQPFITMHVYKKRNGSRIYYPSSTFLQGVYSNNPHNLIRFDVEPGRHIFTLVVSQYERVNDIDFTIYAYSMAPILKLNKLLPYPHAIDVIGKWSSANAGGCGNHPSFPNNPQWRLTLTHGTAVFLGVEAPVNFYVNVKVFSSGNIIKSRNERELFSSGEYRKGFCYCEVPKIGKGVYTILVSTFDPGQVGNFSLNCQTRFPCANLHRIR